MSGTASIHTLAAEDPVRAENAAWSRFLIAQDRAEFCSGWLAILCAQIGRVNAGCLLLGPDENGEFARNAIWPDPSKDLSHLDATAGRAMAERKGIVTAADGTVPPTADNPAHVGYPLDIGGSVHGIVVLDLSPRSEVALQRSLRLVHWASAWLIDQFRQRIIEERDSRLAHMSLAMEITATALRESRLSASAVAVANELAGKMRCERVSIGLEKSRSIAVRSISHTATFDSRMSLVRLLASAMEETHDLESAIVWPPRENDPPGAVAHAGLARDQNDVAICSAPLRVD